MKTHRRNYLVILIMISLGSSMQSFTLDFPNTPAGKRGKEIFDLFNNKSNIAPKEYVRQNCTEEFKEAIPEDQWGGAIVQIRNMTGNVELASVDKDEKLEIVFIIKSKSNSMHFSIMIRVEEVAPNRISSMRIMPAGSPVTLADNTKSPANIVDNDNSKANNIAPNSKISSQELTKVLNSYVDSLVEKDEFSGTILVAKDGVPIYTRVVGMADIGHKVSNKLDTKFCLASMNKMFTGTAIMQLVGQNKIKLDDKVGKYLPDYPNEDVKEKVTIHQLLTHTSGMGLYWSEFFGSAKIREIVTVSDYDNLANTNPLLFEPGEKFFYSNCGPLVLGLIIEKISGLSYDEYIRKYVTEPAGMKNTDCYDISRPVENLAIGYTNGRPLGREFNPRRNNLLYTPFKGGPAGGGYSTVEDLLKFDIALRNFELLDENNFKLMTTGKVDRSETIKYAYLFTEKFVNGERIIGHSGGSAGANSNLAMYMNSGYTVAVMSNYDPPAAENIVAKLEKLLTRK